MQDKPNKNIATHFYYAWWKYLLGLLCLAFVGFVIFGLWTKPKAYQKITLFCIAESFQEDGLQTALQEHLGDIKQVTVSKHLASEGQANLSWLIDTQAASAADIVILPQEYAEAFLPVATVLDDKACDYLSGDNPSDDTLLFAQEG
ncbi:MAG: hypothetical protein FWD76_05485, partial [Firmicutes bacterium]|nr:hypothetical protein [Bacillota bacterium]